MTGGTTLGISRLNNKLFCIVYSAGVRYSHVFVNKK